MSEEVPAALRVAEVATATSLVAVAAQSRQVAVVAPLQMVGRHAKALASCAVTTASAATRDSHPPKERLGGYDQAVAGWMAGWKRKRTVERPKASRSTMLLADQQVWDRMASASALA